MAGLGGHVHDHRPHLHRTRSASLPHAPSKANDEGHANPQAQNRPARPSHLRSVSHLSPVEAKPRNAYTLPTPSSTLDRAVEKIPGLRSKHHHDQDEHKHQKRHRYTQSEVQQDHRQHHKDESLPHLVSGLEKEAQRRGNRYGPDGLVPFGPAGRGNLARMPSTRSHRNLPGDAQGAGPDGLRQRASSDPRRPHAQTVKPKSSVELAVEQAEQRKKNLIKNASRADVERRKRELEEADEEMRNQVAEIGRVGQDITRRLDYSYYNLLEKLGGLVSTISSFRTLSEQSKQLISNFDDETHRLDGEVRGRIQGAKMGFDQREDQIKSLEDKEKELKRRAEDLGRRLENTRTVVANWEKREESGRKAWERIMGISWRCVGVLIVVILSIYLVKEWWYSGDLVKAGLKVPGHGSWNSSLALPAATGSRKALLDHMDMPDDVRDLLKDIGARNNERKSFFSRPAVEIKVPQRQNKEEEKTLRLLDEL